MPQETSAGGSEATTASDGDDGATRHFSSSTEEQSGADDEFWAEFDRVEESDSDDPRSDDPRETGSQSEPAEGLIPSDRGVLDTPGRSIREGIRETGMGQLDMWLGGGLVEGSIVLVEGDPDSIATQFLYNLVPDGYPIIFYSEVASVDEVSGQLDELKMIGSDGREIQDLPIEMDTLQEKFASHESVFDGIDRSPTVVLDSITPVEQHYDYAEFRQILTAFQDSIADDMIGIIHRDELGGNQNGRLTKKIADTTIEVSRTSGPSCSISLKKLHPKHDTLDEIRDLKLIRRTDGTIEVKEQSSVTTSN